LTAPEIFQGKRGRVQVECEGVYSNGTTVVSLVDFPDPDANVEVLLDLDREVLVDLLVTTLETLD